MKNIKFKNIIFSKATKFINYSLFIINFYIIKKFKNIISGKVIKFSNYLTRNLNYFNFIIDFYIIKKLKYIITSKAIKINKYFVNIFDHISILINKYNHLNFIIKKFNKISNFNKFLITLISILFSYLFYVSIPSLYDYQKLQSQLRIHLLNDYNLNINISDKIAYKILPSPHFEVKESILYSDLELDKNILGELKNLKIFVATSSLYNQKNLKLEKIQIRESLFFLNKNNKKFINYYFNNKNTEKKITIKKSKFLLMDDDKIISIFPVKNFYFKYDKEIFFNEVTINGLAFNSDFVINIKKLFLEDESLNFDLKFPKINLSIINTLLPQKKNKDKYKVFSKINFFGSEIKSEFDIDENSLVYRSIKSKIFNRQIDFSGSIEFQPFYLISNIILDQINLAKILNNNNLLLKLSSRRNLIHKNLNSKISMNIKKFSKDNIFNKANLLIQIQNGLLKFDDTIFISEKFGSLKILESKLYNDNERLYFKSNFLIEINNQNKFYNTFQIERAYRIDIKKINFSFETNLNTGKTNIINFQINDVVSDNLTKKINKIIQNNDIDIGKNFNNWIVLKRFLNMIIGEVNQG